MHDADLAQPRIFRRTRTLSLRFRSLRHVGFLNCSALMIRRTDIGIAVHAAHASDP
jgi:hypothetical protein